MATLLVLGASVSQAPAIRYARSAGHRVVAVDGDDAAVGFADADGAECVDFADVDAVVEVARRWDVDGVLAVSSDRAVVPAATVAYRLGLPGIGVDVACRMTDKVLMRARLREAGLPQPAHAAVASRAEIHRASGSLRWPCVLKPVDSGGQRGLFLAGSAEEAALHLAETLAFSRTGRALLETYVAGTELNGLIVVRGGRPTLLTLSDRLRPDGPGFGVGWVHRYPSDLPSEVLECAGEVACSAVEALGLREGIAFPQLIVDSAGDVYVVEVAARIPAGQMADLALHGGGVNLFDVAIAQALGRAVADATVMAQFQRPTVIRFLTAAPGPLPVGTVRAIDGLDRVRAVPGVLAAGSYFTVGETIRPVQVDADRRGYVGATGPDTASALSTADEAAAKLVVDVAAEPVTRATARPGLR